MHIDLWIDVTCPWCYLSVRHLRAALAAFEYRDEVEVVPRAFFLDPDLSESWEKSHAHYLTNVKGVDFDEVTRLYERLDHLGRSEGVVFDFDRCVVAPTSHAHRAIAAARDIDFSRDTVTGPDTATLKLLETIGRAHCEMGLDISDPDILTGCAQDIGIASHDIIGALADESRAAEIFSDYQIALHMGIDQVPTFLIDEQFVIQGLQPTIALTNVLSTAWEHTHDKGTHDEHRH